MVFDRKNRFLAAGLYDPDGPIRVRLLVHRSPREIGPELFRDRVQAALALRSEVVSADTTAFRVLHGENDRMPGLVADLYDRTLVLKLYTAAWFPHLDGVLQAVGELLAPQRVVALVSKNVARSRHCPDSLRGGAVVMDTGPASDGSARAMSDGLRVSFLETGLHFEAEPFSGQKTGFYLDQRENRRKLESLAPSGRLLNVFAYTGGFSLYAARAGANEAVDLDQAAPALAQARRHFELNRSDPGIAGCRHRTIEGDAFEEMEKLARRGERFGTVVVDPPSFTSAAAHRERALGAYRRLTALALPLVEKGGLLVQASCSGRVEAPAFFANVLDSARSAGRPIEEIDRTGHPPDHPIGFPEGAYLKCLWGRVS